MRRFAFGIAVFLLCIGVTPHASAQVKLNLELEQSACLQFEAIHAVVTVLNDTEDPLLIGDATRPGQVELSFELQLQHRRGDAVARTGRGPIVRNVVIEPGETRRLALDIGRWYNATEMGRYLLRAVVSKGGPIAYSPQKMIDVVRGMEVASTTRRVAGYEKLSRTYSLRYWRRDQHEYLFLVVDEEPTQLNYGVFQLGRIVRFAKPTVTVDAKGRLETRHQCGPDCFIRTIFESRRDGVHFMDQRYELPDGSPYPNLKRIHR